MNKQTIQFATVVKDGVIQKIGKSTIYQPKTNFKGGSVKWYEDKSKKADKQKSLMEGVEKMDNKALEVLQPYCENDMRLLKRISQSIFMRFNEPISKADYDDFYSIANMTLWQAFQNYDSDMGISFEIFLRTCLKKKFATEIRDRHREKGLSINLQVHWMQLMTKRKNVVYWTL